MRVRRQTLAWDRAGPSAVPDSSEGASAASLATARAARAQSALRWGWLWIAGIVVIAGLAHGINMWRFPYYESDEGTYMAQAWAVARLGQLAPYTYTYDHAPLGWIQIAAWTTLTGGLGRFGTSVDSGRALMLVFQVASVILLSRIALSVSQSMTVATVAALAFALSAYGVYYHRRVLLDNIATFWMLLSIALLVAGRPRRSTSVLSALASGISVLSKEVTAVLLPALALLVWCRAPSSRRASWVLTWAALVVTVILAYPLLALARGELLPAATMPNGQPEHVSLVSTLQYQLARGRDGGLLDPGSRFWATAAQWAREEPLLVVGGTLASLLSLVLAKRRPVIACLGLATLSFWVFLARGGEIFAFYLVPMLPLLALNLALVVGLAMRRFGSGLRRLQPLIASGGRSRATAESSWIRRCGPICVNRATARTASRTCIRTGRSNSIRRSGRASSATPGATSTMSSRRPNCARTSRRAR